MAPLAWRSEAAILDLRDYGMSGIERVSNLAHVGNAQSRACGAAGDEIAIDEAR
jgi:hypothetical protein